MVDYAAANKYLSEELRRAKSLIMPVAAAAEPMTVRVPEPKDRMRIKAWKTKTKTGCLTCRARRIKCDEAKPHCNRCVSTGRFCDGYQTQTSSTTKSASSSPGSHQVTLVLDPCVLIGTPAEQKSLHFFQTYTIKDLGGFLDSSAFITGVLQAAQFQPAVRHALISLGAIHQQYLAGDSAGLSHDPNANDLQFALQHCNRSIGHLIEDCKIADASATETTLALCMMYFTFSCLRGHHLEATKHLQAGLRILGDADTVTARIGRYPVSLETFREMLVSLDNLARMMLSSDDVTEWMKLPHLVGLQGSSPVHFVSLSEAASWMEYNHNAFISHLQVLARLDKTPENIALAQGRFAQAAIDFAAAGKAIDDLIKRMPASSDPAQERASNMLKLYRTTVVTSLAALAHAPNIPECASDNFDSFFDTKVTLAAKILGEKDVNKLASTIPPRTYKVKPTSADIDAEYSEIKAAFRAKYGRPHPPAFSCRYGVTVPLYITAQRCRNPELRRKAIALMLHYPRREGLWDSVLAGRNALHILRYEEASVDGPVRQASDIAEDDRVVYVSTTFTEERRAEYQFQTVKQMRDGKGEVVGYMSW